MVEMKQLELLDDLITVLFQLVAFGAVMGKS